MNSLQQFLDDPIKRSNLK